MSAYRLHCRSVCAQLIPLLGSAGSVGDDSGTTEFIFSADDEPILSRGPGPLPEHYAERHCTLKQMRKSIHEKVDGGFTTGIGINLSERLSTTITVAASSISGWLRGFEGLRTTRSLYYICDAVSQRGGPSPTAMP